MDNHKSLVNWLFTALIGIVSFFLFMFYKKVDTMAENVNSIIITNAVKDVEISGLSNRITNLERAVNELTQQAQKLKTKQ